MLVTLVVGTTAYSSSGVVYAGSTAGSTVDWGTRHLFGLRLEGQDESYSTVEFSIAGCGGVIPLVPGLPVSLVIAADDGSSPVLYFAGDLQSPSTHQTEEGWTFAYQATDLKRRADYIPVTASDGSGVARYNLQPDDELYLFNLAGLTVGQIVTKLLTANINATALFAAGVGGYPSSGGIITIPATLPAQTVTDLAALSIVPPSSVLLQGDSILDAIEGLIQRYHAQYTLWVRPDGVIRVGPLFGRASHALTVPGGGAAGDPVEWPNYAGPDLKGCYTRVVIQGLDIASAVLSLVDGTLKRNATAGQLAAWTSADYLTPKGSTDQGTASSVTTVNCVVHSDQGTTTWTSNSWPAVGAILYLFYSGGTGIDLFETRQLTSNTALSPGGTATVGWDSSQPLASSTYTRYKIVGQNTAMAEVDRLFDTRLPATGALNLNTPVGAALYPRFPRGAFFGNNSSTVQYFYPTAKVMWSRTGAWPWFEVPVEVRLRPDTGQIDLIQPAVFLSADLAGQKGALANGFPASTSTGLYYDVQVLVPYNRGSITATWPASSYSGTAFTKYGLQRTLSLHYDTFVWAGDTAAMTLLAAQHLAVVQNTVLEGSIVLHHDAWTPTFDPLVIGYSLAISVPGGSPLDGEDLPVRSFTVEWPDDGPDIQRVTFHFSTRRRPFEGDDLYLHPTFSTRQFGTQQGQTFVAGQVGGHSGDVDTESLGRTMMGHADPGESEGFDPGGDVGGLDDGMGEGMGMDGMGDGDGEMPDSRSGHPGRQGRRDARGRATLPPQNPHPFVGPPAPLRSKPRDPIPPAPPRPRPIDPGPATRADRLPSFVGPPERMAGDPEGLPVGEPIDPNPPRTGLAEMRGQPRPPAPRDEPTVRSVDPGPASLADMKPTPEPPPPRRKLADIRGTRDDTTDKGAGGGG